MFIRLFVCAAIVFSAGHAYSAGSLAIDSGQGKQYGFSYNYSNFTKADQKALEECGYGCNVVLRFEGQCAAYAADQASGSSAYGWGKSSTNTAAQNKALQECRSAGGNYSNCIVRVYGCDNK